MFIIGITWTDGKTTTSSIAHYIINSNLGKAAMISTAGIYIWDQIISNDTKKTSLDIMDLYKFLSQAKAANCEYAIIEVSSHGLEQYRFYGLDFNIATLTNISMEHMDYHHNIDEYANIKKKLFTGILNNPIHPKMAIFPKDDEYGRKRSEELLFDKSFDYGIRNNAAIRAENIQSNLEWTKFDLIYLWQNYPITTKLQWQFNVYNTLAAMWISFLLWLEIDKVIQSVQNFESVNGRMNIYQSDQKTYIVDFAHTPRALESVLTYLNTIKWSAKLITVFGAPWLRDIYKRPEMWKIADNMSDVVIVTEDDSMTESTDLIISQISKWINRTIGNNYYIINNRPQAIQLATEISDPWDIILLAGKWHENYLYTNYGKYPHNDMDYLKSILQD